MNIRQTEAATKALRQSIIDHLQEPKTVRELTKFVATGYYNMHYHINKMVELGCIVVAGQIKKSGAIAFMYRSAVKIYQHPVAVRVFKSNKDRQAEHIIQVKGARMIKLEDYQDNYKATQKLRTHSKRSAWIGSTLSTMTF